MRLLFVLMTMLLLSLPATAERRAFIVGVGDYSELTDLKKTRGDAKGYKLLFKETLGFKIGFIRENPERRDFIASFDEFVRSISPGDEVVFVFSGHGWSDGSENYLSFADTPRSVSEAVLRAETVPFEQSVMAQLRQREPKLILSIIDACRDERYDPLTKSSSALEKGIVRVSANEGELILYSAGAGQTSLDRLSDHDTSNYSVFSRVLLPLLSDSDKPLAQIANETRREVQRLANTVGHPQRPEMMLGIDLNYCLSGDCRSFAGGKIQRQNSPAIDPQQIARAKFEREIWDLADSKKTKAQYAEYLSAYPSGVYAAEAKRRMGQCSLQNDGVERWEAVPSRDFTENIRVYGTELNRNKSRACSDAKEEAEAEFSTLLTRMKGYYPDYRISLGNKLYDERDGPEYSHDDKYSCGWRTKYELSAERRSSPILIEICP